MHNGGDPTYVDHPEKLPKAEVILPVYATNSGYIELIDCDICGSIARYIGAGRMNDKNEIDNTAGIVLEKKIGDQVQAGEILAYVHTNEISKAEGATRVLSDAFKYSSKAVKQHSRILDMYYGF